MNAEPKPLRTTGDLRMFLSMILVQVRNGSIDADAARVLVKLAAQINESIYSETKAAQIALELKRDPPMLGELPLGGSSS